MVEEKAVLFIPELSWQFGQSLEKEVLFKLAGRKCPVCQKTVMGLIFEQWRKGLDCQAVFSIALTPLTRVVFGIHNNLFHYRLGSKRSKHFPHSAHYIYVCEECVCGIAGRIATHIPEIRDRYFAGEIIDDPKFDVELYGEEEKGCWITVEGFSETSSINVRHEFLNYQTSLKRFDEIISIIGVNLENMLPPPPLKKG